MKKDNTPLVDKYLQSLEGMQEAEADQFFYTRLRNKMERHKEQEFNWRPVLTISILLLFLFVNIWMINQQRDKQQNETSSLQSFAQMYDFTVSDNY